MGWRYLEGWAAGLGLWGMPLVIWDIRTPERGWETWWPLRN